MGCEIEEFDDAVRVRAGRDFTAHTCEDTSISGIPTDMQPQMAVTLALAEEQVLLQRVFLRTVSNMWTSLQEWEPMH